MLDVMIERIARTDPFDHQPCTGVKDRGKTRLLISIVVSIGACELRTDRLRDRGGKVQHDDSRNHIDRYSSVPDAELPFTYRGATLPQVQPRSVSFILAYEISSDNGSGCIFDRLVSGVVSLAEDVRLSVIRFAIVELCKGRAICGERGSDRA